MIHWSPFAQVQCTNPRTHCDPLVKRVSDLESRLAALEKKSQSETIFAARRGELVHGAPPRHSEYKLTLR